MISERDREAMATAIEQQRAVGPAEAEQIDAFLTDRGFEYAGLFAAYSLQSDNLCLRPWEHAPAWLAPDEVDAIIAAGPAGDRYGAAPLAKRMLDAGISLFVTDPER